MRILQGIWRYDLGCGPYLSHVVQSFVFALREGIGIKGWVMVFKAIRSGKGSWVNGNFNHIESIRGLIRYEEMLGPFLHSAFALRDQQLFGML